MNLYQEVAAHLWNYWIEIKQQPEAIALFSARYSDLYQVLRSKYSANTLMNGGIKKVRLSMLEASGIVASYEEIKAIAPFSLIQLSQADYDSIKAANRKSLAKPAYSILPEHLEFWQEYCDAVLAAPILTVKDAVKVFCIAMLCTGKRKNEIVWTSFFNPVAPDSRFMDFAGQSKVKASQGDLMVEGRIYCLFANSDKIFAALQVARKIVKGAVRLSPDQSISELAPLPELESEADRDKWLDANRLIFDPAIAEMFSSLITEFEEGDLSGLSKGDKSSITRKIYFNLMVANHEKFAIGVPRTSDFLSGLYLNHLGDGSSQNYQRCYVRADSALAINPGDRFWVLGSPLG